MKINYISSIRRQRKRSGNKGAAQQKAEGLDKLGQIHVISREEGSGTRNTFAELAGFKDNNSRNTDNTLGVLLSKNVVKRK